MRYDIRTGVQHKKVNMKKVIVTVIASIGMVGGMAVPAFATKTQGDFGPTGVGDGSQASACGAIHGAFADVNGNFGWLGPLGGTPGYHDAVGQQPGATGYNNSHTDCQL